MDDVKKNFSESVPENVDTDRSLQNQPVGAGKHTIKNIEWHKGSNGETAM